MLHDIFSACSLPCTLVCLLKAAAAGEDAVHGEARQYAGTIQMVWLQPVAAITAQSAAASFFLALPSLCSLVRDSHSRGGLKMGQMESTSHEPAILVRGGAEFQKFCSLVQEGPVGLRAT